MSLQQKALEHAEEQNGRLGRSPCEAETFALRIKHDAHENIGGAQINLEIDDNFKSILLNNKKKKNDQNPFVVETGAAAAATTTAPSILPVL